MTVLKKPILKKEYKGKWALQKKPDGKKNAVHFRWQRPSLRGALMVIVPALCVAAVLTVVLIFTSRTNRYTIEGQAAQYYVGSMYRVADGAKMIRTRNGETVLKQGDSERTMTALPVYYEDQQKIVLPQNMVYYDPRSNTSGRLDHFTEIIYQKSNGNVTVQRGKETTPVYQGFLYDGSDLYLFLEPTVLTFNGYRIELGSMSYVEAVYTGNIMVYDRETGEFIMEAPTGPVQVQAVSGDYTVSLLSDSMESHDGSKTLLITRPEVLDRIV